MAAFLSCLKLSLTSSFDKKYNQSSFPDWCAKKKTTIILIVFTLLPPKMFLSLIWTYTCTMNICVFFASEKTSSFSSPFFGWFSSTSLSELTRLAFLVMKTIVDPYLRLITINQTYRSPGNQYMPSDNDSCICSLLLSGCNKYNMTPKETKVVTGDKAEHLATTLARPEKQGNSRCPPLK